MKSPKKYSFSPELKRQTKIDETNSASVAQLASAFGC